MGLDLQPLHLGRFDRLTECASCAGTGLAAGARCAICRGDGKVLDGFTLDVLRALARLAPPGVDFLRFEDEQQQRWREVLRGGDVVEPRRIQILPAVPDDDGTMSIDDFLGDARSAHWTVGGDGDDERWPDLPLLLLPRHEAPWDWMKLATDSVLSRVANGWNAESIRTFVGDLQEEIDAWPNRCGDMGRYVLEGALTQQIVMTFG